MWEEWWLDLGSLADEASTSADPATAAAGLAVRAELGDVVLLSYTNPPATFASGLTIFTDTTRRSWIDAYASGPWTSHDWPTLLGAVHDAGL